MGAISDVPAKAVIEQLTASHGNVSHAARKLGTSRKTLHAYINDHPTVAAALDDIREGEIDDAELMLYDRMRSSDALLIFFLKTRGNKRGYSERNQLEISGPNGDDIPIRVVDYRHGLATVAPGPDDDSE